MTVDRMNKIKEYFHIYDKDNDGYITYDDVVSIIRTLSHNPTEKELNEIIPKINEKRYDFSEYFEICGKFKKIHSLDNLLDGAKLFDKEGTGFLDVATVRYFMTNSKEKLPKEEVEEIISVLAKSGYININELVKYLYN